MPTTGTYPTLIGPPSVVNAYLRCLEADHLSFQADEWRRIAQGIHLTCFHPRYLGTITSIGSQLSLPFDPPR